MKTKIAAYFRVSSKAQKDENTIHRQIHNFEAMWPSMSAAYELLEKIPGAKGHDRYFIDEGFNLEKWDETTDFYRLIALCNQGEAQAIYISEADRLFRSRSNELRGRILDIVRDRKIEIVTKNGVISANSIIMEFMSSLSAEDKRGILRKCHDGKITRLKDEGRPPTGKAPFGFHWDKRSKEWSLVPKEIQLIKAAASLSLGKVLSPDVPAAVKVRVGMNPKGLNDKQVAKELNQMGFSKRPTTRQNQKYTGLTSGSIEGLFRDDRYRGFLEFRMISADLVGNQRAKSEIEKIKYPVKVPPVFSDDVWRELQLRRNKRRKWATRNLVHEYLCKDLLICQCCGIALAARPKYTVRTLRSGQAVNYPATLYYVCARKQKVDGFRCPANTCHPVRTVDSLLWESVSGLISSPLNLKKLFKKCELNSSHQTRKEELRKLADQKMVLITGYEQKIVASRKLWSEDQITEAEYAAAFKLCTDKIKSARLDLEQIESGIGSLRANTSINDLLAEVQKIDFQMAPDFERRREILCALVSKVEMASSGQMTVSLKGGVIWEV